MFDELKEIAWTILEEYLMELQDMTLQPMPLVTLQNTSSNIYILDINCEMLIRKMDEAQGFFSLALRNDTPPKASDIDWLTIIGRANGSKLTFPSLLIYTTDGVPLRSMLTIDGVLNEHDKIPQNSDVHCCGYNLTLADSENGTIIEDATISRCGGSTLRSFIIGKSAEFRHLKRISLFFVPITELTVKDIMYFPELHTLLLAYVPIAHLENGLLCNNLNITTFFYQTSFGYLTIFPHQIFSCTIDLKLEYFHLENHSIASLPAQAFGSAAKQLTVLSLSNIGLKVIHMDAFSGLLNLRLVAITYNKLLQVSSAIIPPASASLRAVNYRYNELSGILNLTEIFIARFSSLQIFDWTGSNISEINGKFCSDQLHSALEIIRLADNMIETIPGDIFHHCISLKLLYLVHNELVYLPDQLFASNVSQLEKLLLMDNRLSSNTSWSDVLMPLRDLKYLNLSNNMLTSWTYNLNGLWKLEVLDLSHNAITRISHIAFINIPMLRFLSLDENSLTVLTPKVQHGFAHIPLLNIKSNSIHQLNMSAETMPTDTVILDVSANNLTYLNLPSKRKCSLMWQNITIWR